jgi:hypothetical protein
MGGAMQKVKGLGAAGAGKVAGKRTCRSGFPAWSFGFVGRWVLGDLGSGLEDLLIIRDI